MQFRGVRQSNRFWKNSDSVWFGLKKTCHRSQIGYCNYLPVIYYLCNTWVVNLQQILQRYCVVLNELCMPYAKLVLKCFLSAHCMQAKLFLSLLIWTADCTYFLSEKPFVWMSNFWTVQIFYIRNRTVFLFTFVSRTPLMQFSLIQNNCTVPTKRKLPSTNTAANTNIIIITDIIFTVINDIKVWDNSANLHDKHKNCTIKPNKMTTHYWVPQHTQHSCRVVNS